MFNQVKSRTHFDFKVKRNEIQLSIISRVDVGDVYRKKNKRFDCDLLDETSETYGRGRKFLTIVGSFESVLRHTETQRFQTVVQINVTRVFIVVELVIHSVECVQPVVPCHIASTTIGRRR